MSSGSASLLDVVAIVAVVVVIAIAVLAFLIDWRMQAPMWDGIIMKPSGAIDAGSEARNRAGSLISWLIAADIMTKEEREAVRRTYNQAFGIDVNDPEQAKSARELPEPVAAAKLAA